VNSNINTSTLGVPSTTGDIEYGSSANVSATEENEIATPGDGDQIEASQKSKTKIKFGAFA